VQKHARGKGKKKKGKKRGEEKGFYLEAFRPGPANANLKITKIAK
jgi:hypothetical protein